MIKLKKSYRLRKAAYECQKGCIHKLATEKKIFATPPLRPCVGGRTTLEVGVKHRSASRAVAWPLRSRERGSSRLLVGLCRAASLPPLCAAAAAAADHASRRDSTRGVCHWNWNRLKPARALPCQASRAHVMGQGRKPEARPRGTAPRGSSGHTEACPVRHCATSTCPASPLYAPYSFYQRRGRARGERHGGRYIYVR